ncbi:MAG TPA: class II aldolase/adducin family protein [Hyphomicrobiaceae bacterium]|nr:class II aldolase/adducin family protein [Hyphomicrobiaceae bacterium]
MAPRKPKIAAAELDDRREVGRLHELHPRQVFLAMSTAGLSPGRSGNVSARHADGMLITPSGVAYDTLDPADIVHVRADGRVDPGQLKPSSEWRFHLATYAARPDACGIVHCHSLSATALACTKKPIPAFHYMVAAAGGADIPVVPYATFGTEELSRHVVAGLKDRNACLMANHGQIAVAASVGAALELAHEVEVLAEMYIKVLAIGAPHILDAAEMARMLTLFRSYGQRAQDGAKPEGKAKA